MQHAEREYGQRQDSTNPQPPRHVVEIVIFFGRSGDRFRLERHSADATAAGLILLDLRMHRARPYRSVGLAIRWIALQRHAALRTIARLIAFHTFAHGTEVLRVLRRFHCRSSAVSMTLMRVIFFPVVVTARFVRMVKGFALLALGLG